MEKTTEKSIIKEFLKSPLFEGSDTSLMYHVLVEKAQIRTYASGSIVMKHGKIIENEEEGSPSIIFVSSGKCLISSCSKTNSVLRMCQEKELIGLAGVFSSDEIETKVVACGGKKTVILSLDIDGLYSLMNEDKTNSVRNNLYKMLAAKISFLNKKISTLTGGKAEKKLAMFLLSFDKEEFDIGMSMKALSSMLDIGRSSLYRSIDTLEAKGIIRRKDNLITILKRDYLKNI